MKTKQCAHQLSRSHKARQRVPFLDDARRIMSKIWSLLRCIRAIRNMLRNRKWCILMDETCFIVKCTHVKFSFAIPPFLLSLSLPRHCWRTKEKYSTETRLSHVVDCWPTTASNVQPNRRTGGASGQRSQDQRVASVICSAHDEQPERGHTR